MIIRALLITEVMLSMIKSLKGYFPFVKTKMQLNLIARVDYCCGSVDYCLITRSNFGYRWPKASIEFVTGHLLDSKSLPCSISTVLEAYFIFSRIISCLHTFGWIIIGMQLLREAVVIPFLVIVTGTGKHLNFGIICSTSTQLIEASVWALRDRNRTIT